MDIAYYWTVYDAASLCQVADGESPTLDEANAEASRAAKQAIRPRASIEETPVNVGDSLTNGRGWALFNDEWLEN